MTRILALSNWYPPHHYGGYELGCHDVMEGLIRRGHDVEVLCSDHRLSSVDAAPSSESHVHRELEMYFRNEKLYTPSPWTCLAIERRNRTRVMRLLDQFRPDVVSVWQPSALGLGVLTTIIERRTPLVYSVCDDWLVYALQLDPWGRQFAGPRWRRWLGRMIRPLVGVPTAAPDIGASGAFCFMSDFTRRTAARDSPWRFPRSTVVWGGVDDQQFVPRPVEPSWSWRLLFTGRFDPRKGADTLVRALPLLPPEATASFFGRGGQEEVSRLRAVASEVGVADRVTFGSRDRSELAPEYRAADVLVFPSEWDEPFGLVPLEAMASGAPVVATGSGGSAEFLVNEGNCLLFDRGNPESLQRAVRRLAVDVELRHHVVEGGLRTVRELSLERLVDVFERWHVAAAEGYVEGTPSDRAPILLPSARRADAVDPT